MDTIDVKKLEDVIRQLTDESGRHEERRLHERQQVTLHLDVETLDEGLNPTGTEILMMTLDLSTAGIGLLSPKSVTADHLLVPLGGMKLVAKVKWTTPYWGGAFQRIGAEFIGSAG